MCAYSSISLSPALLPTATIGRRPMCAWMVSTLAAPSFGEPWIAAVRTSTTRPSRRSKRARIAEPTTSSGSTP